MRIWKNTQRPGEKVASTRRLISSGSTFEKQIGYSRAVRDGQWVFVSGTTGFNFADMTISPDLSEQTEQTLRNIEIALRDAGAAISDIVRVRYMLSDGSRFAECWPVLHRWFGKVLPAATMMQAPLMDERMLIEIEATARVHSSLVNWLPPRRR